jgi:soluble lytic murein transglycosylase-like protein
MAIIDHESARTWNPKITNGYDDGLMQVNRVHQIYDVYNPRVNISFGFKYYKKCLVKKKSLSVAIMAYNAGPNRQVYTNYRYLQQILRRI